MTIIPDWIPTVAAVGTALSAAATAIGVFYAFRQLQASKRIAQMQFEDGLAKEYRDIVGIIPTKAMLGEDISEDDYQKSFSVLHRYIDLTNEQVSLRKRGRISKEVWWYWLDGIKANLFLPVFHRAWAEIKEKSKSFQELRRLEREGFKTDPAKWKNEC